jgi:hypothetical protein
LQQAREQTVSRLAQSRFDWERVLRELAIVIPDDVWLTNLSASVSPEAADSSASTSASSSGSSSVNTESILGPSLGIQGCAKGQEAVARFIASLHDIDGITRVTVLSSDRPDPGTASAASGASGTAGAQGCSDRGFVAQFDVITAFDAVQPTAALDSALAPVESSDTGTTPASSSTGGDQSQVADAGQQLQQQKDSAAAKTQKGHDAVNTFIPGTGSAP